VAVALLGAGAVVPPAVLWDWAGALGVGEDSAVLGASATGFGEGAIGGADEAALGISVPCAPGAPPLLPCAATDAAGALACSAAAPPGVMEGATPAGDGAGGVSALGEAVAADG